jgi:hypothetical protein
LTAQAISLPQINVVLRPLLVLSIISIDTPNLIHIEITVPW